MTTVDSSLADQAAAVKADLKRVVDGSGLVPEDQVLQVLEKLGGIGSKDEFPAIISGWSKDGMVNMEAFIDWVFGLQTKEEVAPEERSAKPLQQSPAVPVSPVVESTPSAQEVAPAVQAVESIPAVPVVAPAVQSVESSPAVPEVASVVQPVDSIPKVPEVAPAVESVKSSPALLEVAPAVQSVESAPEVLEVAPVVQSVEPEVVPVVESVETGAVLPKAASVEQSVEPSPPITPQVASSESPPVEKSVEPQSSQPISAVPEVAPVPQVAPVEESDVAPVDQSVQPVQSATTLLEDVRVELTLRDALVFPEKEDEIWTYVLASVKTPADEAASRQASDLACVLDVSGSMGMEATIQGSSGASESHGLSLLDVAKHGIRTIIKTLGEKDRLAIVTFNTGANVVFPMRVMDADGQRLAEEALDSVRAIGGTNIWEGLKSGLEELRKDPVKGSLGHVMLLTDGESTNRDTIMPNLDAYQKTYERLPGTISTFGFGYRLDSELLVSLAEFGSGSYSFIPDAGFVGTAFVNTMSNLLVTMAREVYLMLTVEDGEIVDNRPMGGYPAEAVGLDGVRVNLGTLQYGQAKDIVLAVRLNRGVKNDFLLAQVQYETAMGIKEEPPCTEIDASKLKKDEVDVHRCRCIFADCLREAVACAKPGTQEACSKAAELLAKAILDVQKSSACETDVVQKLLEDMQGQSTEALSKAEWFQKWGRHYLPSVMFAHRLQQCNNFKDPGVQVYGGSLFASIQEIADEFFNQLPPPKPSMRHTVVSSAPAPSMAAFNDRYAG